MSALQDGLAAAGYAVEMEGAERFNRDRFVVLLDGTRVGRGTWFRGGRHIKPWIELQPKVRFDPDTEQDQELFTALVAVLEPGSHCLVHYLADRETAEAITADVPPPATPLGFLLWRAGVRWFKDWYFTEGWMEGDQKLQGNLPLNADVREEREQEWRERLEQYATEGERDGCVARAERILAAL